MNYRWPPSFVWPGALSGTSTMSSSASSVGVPAGPTGLPASLSMMHPLLTNTSRLSALGSDLPPALMPLVQEEYDPFNPDIDPQLRMHYHQMAATNKGMCY